MKNKHKVLEYSRSESGYDNQITKFRIEQKFEGISPDIAIIQNGPYSGRLDLSIDGARELAKNLLFLVGEG